MRYLRAAALIIAVIVISGYALFKIVHVKEQTHIMMYNSSILTDHNNAQSLIEIHLKIFKNNKLIYEGTDPPVSEYFYTYIYKYNSLGPCIYKNSYYGKESGICLIEYNAPDYSSVLGYNDIDWNKAVCTRFYVGFYNDSRAVKFVASFEINKKSTIYAVALYNILDANVYYGPNDYCDEYHKYDYLKTLVLYDKFNTPLNANQGDTITIVYDITFPIPSG